MVNVTSGAVAGMTSAVLFHPLTVIMTRFQGETESTRKPRAVCNQSHPLFDSHTQIRPYHRRIPIPVLPPCCELNLPPGGRGRILPRPDTIPSGLHSRTQFLFSRVGPDHRPLLLPTRFSQIWEKWMGTDTMKLVNLSLGGKRKKVIPVMSKLLFVR